MGCVCRMGELLFRPVGGAVPVSVVVSGVVWDAVHEGWVLLEEGGGTLGRWGLRAVGTTLGQWIPTLVEQACSSQLEPVLGGAGVKP